MPIAAAISKAHTSDLTKGIWTRSRRTEGERSYSSSQKNITHEVICQMPEDRIIRQAELFVTLKVDISKAALQA